MPIYALSSTKPLAIHSIGGKALALQRMLRAGYPVPPGCILSVDFFAPWYAILEASPAWQALTNGREESIHSAAQTLQALCRSLRLTDAQQQELVQAISALQASRAVALFAVRSSSPDEDLAQASFAGGYETTLGVTPDRLEEAIRRSFNSSLDARVFLYKQERGIPIVQPRIAVIIQQQIDAEAAGVAFSLNPLNNCFDEAVINANQGLGESVVAGEADPDQFVIDKLNHKIIDTRIGAKQTVIRLEPSGGTQTIPRATQTATAITQAQALALTDLLRRVEAQEGKPVDIEWAIADGEIYLLQVRPITTYLPLPPEMITAPGEPKRLYANSTLIEQGLQEPLSALGTDFLRYVLNKVGGPIAEGAIGLDGITFTASGGYYMNVSHAQMLGLRGAGLAPGSFGDPRVLEILDSIDMQEYMRGALPPRLKAMRGQMVFKMLPMIGSVLGATFRPQRMLQAYQAALPEALKRLKNFSGAGISLEQQALELTSHLEFFYGRYGIPMVLSGQMAQRRIHQLFADQNAEVKDHLANLGIALPGNKTTEMGEAMATLAAAPELEQYGDPGVFLADVARGALSPEFTQRWEHFLAEFGMRCPGEIDPATPRPRENPAQLFRQLKTMALAIQERGDNRSFFEEARAKREAAYQALRERALLGGRRRVKTFEKLYQTWLTFGGYRETPKHSVITVIDLFRRSALDIAARLVADGRLDAPEQIFDLTIADIDAGLADPALDLRARAFDRSALIRQIRQSKQAARLIDSRGKIFFPPRKTAAAGELSGVPISPGLIQGHVKVLHTAGEKPVLPGEILVARATDPGWTPLFLNARGIILEVGGALQHGAVVAREYGIPCVSGVENATGLLQDGQLVEVDGSNGLVRVLDGPIPPAQTLTAAEIQQQNGMATRIAKEKTRQQVRQTVLRLIPIVLLPFLLILLAGGGYLVVQVLGGNSLPRAFEKLTALLRASLPTLRTVTLVVAAPILASNLWKNRKKIGAWLKRLTAA